MPKQEHLEQILEWEQKFMIPMMGQLLYQKKTDSNIETLEKCVRIIKWASEAKKKVESLN